MESTSPSQSASTAAGTVPALELVRDDVWALGIAMPGGHIPYSLLYLLRDTNAAIHVIDPGWSSDDNWQALVDALASIDATPRDVASITATHLHPDHIAMSQRLQEATGAPLQLLSAERDALRSRGDESWSPSVLDEELEAWGVPAKRTEELRRIVSGAPELPNIRVDHGIEDGERLQVPGFDLITMATPGHTPGHLTLRDDNRSLIFTGDTVLPTMHAGLGLGGATTTNPLTDYLESLRRLSTFDSHEVLPGHGYRFRGLEERAAQSAEHHLRRSREVAGILNRHPHALIWDIAAELTWTAGWENLTGFYVYSALAQTQMHKGFVESGGLDGFATLAPTG